MASRARDFVEDRSEPARGVVGRLEFLAAVDECIGLRRCQARQCGSEIARRGLRGRRIVMARRTRLRRLKLRLCEHCAERGQ